MAESNKDQSKPLAPLSLTTRTDDPLHFQNATTKHINAQIHFQTRSKLILCCGFIASLTLLFAVTFIVLSVTVFHLRNPKLTVDSLSFIKSFEIVNGKINTNQNATVLVTVSLSNPNFASFKVRDATVLLYYGGFGMVGGGVKTSPEKVPAKRTAQMNLTAEIVTSKLVVFVPGLMEDLKGRGTELRISVGVNGRVKIAKIFKKSVHIKKECTIKMKMMMNNLTFEDINCDEHGEI